MYTHKKQLQVMRNISIFKHKMRISSTKKQRYVIFPWLIMAEHELRQKSPFPKHSAAIKSAMSGPPPGPHNRYSPVLFTTPQPHLKGDWLKEAGFDTGRGVMVRFRRGA